MTLTIKSDTVLMGPPLELWKPKRHEIVAVLAYLWMGRNRGLMAELGFPGFEVRIVPCHTLLRSVAVSSPVARRACDLSSAQCKYPPLLAVGAVFLCVRAC